MLLGIFALVLSWEISWAGLMYVVASEVLPSSIRGVGMGSVVFCFWVSLFSSQLLFEAFFQWFALAGTDFAVFVTLASPGTFMGLSACAVVIAATTYLVVPDLTGQPLRSTTSDGDEDMWPPATFAVGGILEQDTKAPLTPWLRQDQRRPSLVRRRSNAQ